MRKSRFILTLDLPANTPSYSWSLFVREIFSELINCPTDLTDLLNASLNDWLNDGLTAWRLRYWLTDWLTDWKTDCLTDWLFDCVTDWLCDWLTDWLTDCHSASLSEYLTERQTGSLFDTDCLTDESSCQVHDGLTGLLAYWRLTWLIDWMLTYLL